MIQVETVGPDARVEWNSYVEKNPDSIAWQVYDWSDVVALHYKYQFIPMAAKQGGAIVGILPLYLGAVGRTRGLVSVPFAVAGGILGDNDEIRQALLEQAILLSHKEGDIPITLKQYKIKIPGNLKTDGNYCNRELSLTRDLNEIKRQISERNLESAEGALRMGLEVEYPARDVSAFYDILLRYHLAQGIPCVSEAWIRTLIDFGMYSFALARFEGRVIAATMVKRFKKTVSFPFSCIHPRVSGAEVHAYGLYWQLISQFAKDGFEIFHSGRIPKTQETVQFRLGWGGKEHPYFYQYYPNAGPTEFDTRRGWKRRLVSAAWKGLPLTVARNLGPLLVKRFP